MKSILEPARAAAAKLNHEEIRRYSRHLIMPEVTMEGQQRLKASSILLIGTGGLGSPLALYLAAAGIGRLGLVDFDVVDETNLQRQIVHGTKDVGRRKIESAKDRIHDVNPNVNVDLHETRLSSQNAKQIAAPYDVVIDGTDNFPTRYLANDVSVLLKKPNVYGSIFRFEGQASVFAPHLGGPCYRCFYPEPPPPGSVPSCAEGGVLGVLPGIIGVIQAIEAVKLIVGIGEPLIGRLVLFDALQMRFRELKLRRNPKCPLCGEHPSIRDLVDYEQFCGIGRGETPDAVSALAEISVRELKARLDRREDFVLLDVREPFEYQICRIPGSTLIPLGELPKRVAELDRGKEILIHCKSGGRSKKAVKLLQEAGFARLKNVAGGIEAWSDEVDASVPKY
ncbi:MAG: molybdopterin-synthase adenylyltransferase MoeB [Verrucomicrobiae bacterium]|nr:molybdopterin-synthase adenylyltransferase MoeB [Verrucomicrobiae bacterium]